MADLSFWSRRRNREIAIEPLSDRFVLLGTTLLGTFRELFSAICRELILTKGLKRDSVHLTLNSSLQETPTSIEWIFWSKLTWRFIVIKIRTHGLPWIILKAVHATKHCNLFSYYVVHKKQHCKNLGLEQTKFKFSRTKFSKMSKREILFFVSVQIFFVFGPRRRIPGKKFGLASKRKKCFRSLLPKIVLGKKFWVTIGHVAEERWSAGLPLAWGAPGSTPALFCFAWYTRERLGKSVLGKPDAILEIK